MCLAEYANVRSATVVASNLDAGVAYYHYIQNQYDSAAGRARQNLAIELMFGISAVHSSVSRDRLVACRELCHRRSERQDRALARIFESGFKNSFFFFAVSIPAGSKYFLDTGDLQNISSALPVFGGIGSDRAFRKLAIS